MLFHALIPHKNRAACPPAHGRNRLTKSPRNSATAGFIFMAIVCAMVASGGVALAGEPAQPTSPSLAQSIDALVKFFMGGVGMALIWVIKQIPGNVRKIAQEQIAAANQAAADKRDAALPQPISVSHDNPPAGSRELADHIRHNKATHDAIFKAQRDGDEVLRKETAALIAAAMSEVKKDIHELRAADKETSENLGREIHTLTGKVGELIGRMAAR